MTAPGHRTRRALLLAGLAGGGAALWLGWPRLAALWPVRLDFTPLSDPPGFRRLGKARRSAFSPLAGLSGAPAARAADPPLCAGLFGGPPPPGIVPIACFTDYRCPYCAVLDWRLHALADDPGAVVRLTWHDWPVLGRASDMAARAAVAAGRQGAYRAFHKALMGSAFIPTEGYLRDLATRAGIDPDRLIAEMDGPAVARRLAVSAALAARLGFAGTPGLVVGRSVVEGAVGAATLAALVARERAEGPVPGCA